MVALGVLITIGVEEIRSRAMKRTLLTEVQTLQENNQELQTKNDELTQKIKTLEAELRTKIRIVPNR
jgi:FtsZ-binding cell division protein ZapB